ncbi:MAG: roadblock/LC7 domain-containing protein [Gemmatimonadaceae bacterium]
MIAPLEAVLEPLARTKGVRAALLAVEDDGVPVHTVAHEDVDADTLAALGCRLYRSARLASARAGFGASTVMHIEAEMGQVCVTRAGNDDGPMVLIVLAESDANIGAVRLALSRAAQETPETA